MKKTIYFLIVSALVLICTNSFAEQTRSEKHGDYTYHYDRSGNYIGTSSVHGDTTYHNIRNPSTGEAHQSKSVNYGDTTFNYKGDGSYRGTTTTTASPTSGFTVKQD